MTKPSEKIQKLYKTIFYDSRQKLLTSEDTFYAVLLSKCAVEINEEVKTISIKEDSGTIYIVYSNKWFNSLSVEEGAEAIKHVLNHLIFGHLKNKEFIKNDTNFEIAKDLAVNTNLNKEKLPKGFSVPKDFELKEKQSTYYYYNKLGKCKKQNENSLKNNPDKDSENKKPKEEENQANNSQPNNTTNNSPNINQKTGDNHNYMTCTSGKGQVQKQTKQMVRDSYKQAGNRNPSNWGGGLEKIMNILLRPPEIPWNVILRNFVAFSSKVKKVNTWKKPNRRFGEILQGNRKIQTLNIVVAIDESGSIGNDEWKQFMSEINGIAKTKLAQITIIKFTAVVEKVFEFKNMEEVTKSRFDGGTCFQPFLNTTEEIKPDCVICLTDGYNSEGDNLKYNRFNTVLWCLTPDGKENKNGHNIKIKKIHEEKELFW